MTHVATEREAFEAWYAKRHPVPTHENSTWAHASKMDDWEVWQARAVAAPAAVAPQGERQWICPTRTVADLVNNLLTMDQALPIYGAQYIERDGSRCAIAVPPTVSRERVKDSRWIGQGEELNAAVVWTRAEQPAAVAEPALDVRAIAAAVCQRVAELPDRDSPEDWPEAMLVTGAELIDAVADEIEQALSQTAAAARPAPATFMTKDRACEWAWDKVREEVGTKGWTTGDSCNFYGFFLHGWNYRGQYELQRSTAMAALKQELMTAAPALEAPAAPVVPAGFALVPLRLTRAMDEAISEEGWQWEDLLAAAQAVTEEQYEASAQDRLSRDEVRAIFLECGFVIKEGQADLKPYVYEAAQVLESRVRAIAAAAPQAPAAPAVDAELLELAQAIVKFNREHGSVLAVHIDNLADLVDERAAQAAANGENGNG